MTEQARQCEFLAVEGGGFKCAQCDFPWPRPIRRECRALPSGAVSSSTAEVPPRRQVVLTEAGEKLLQVAPGDRLAAVIEHSGAKAAWEAILGHECEGCQRTQTWMNRQWEGLVRTFFSRVAEE